MSNFFISNELYKLSQILEFKGNDKRLVTDIKILAYTIQSLTFELDASNFDRIEKYLTDKPKIKNIIKELVLNGKSEYIDILSKDVPPSLLKLLKIPGIGMKTLYKLYKEFNIMDIYSLKSLVKEKKLRTIDIIGEKGEEIIGKNINYYFKLQREFSISYADSIFNYIKEILLGLNSKYVEKAGSVRRRKEVVSNLNVVCANNNAIKLKSKLKDFNIIRNFEENGDFVNFKINDSEIDINILICPEEYFNSALLYFTGPKSLNNFLYDKSKNLGIQILPTNYLKLDYNEKQIFNLFDLPYIPPEFREHWEKYINMDKNLLSYNIKGDLHIHSNYSDGISSIYEIVRESKDLGYKYIGISDHAEDLKFAKGLSEKRIYKERLEIRKIEKLFNDIKIFFGIEANIRNDGSIDVNESILKDLDFVIASIHNNFNEDLNTNMKRLINAIRNPFVTIIGHPTGRKISERDEMKIDWKKFYKEVENSKTILEINSAPDRLDLYSNIIYENSNFDVLYSISSDCHFAPQLNFVSQYGINIAKRALLEDKKIINNYEINDLVKIMNKKRESRNFV
ncbi:MAG TPA: PHP domain-containing protein [Caldisericia bacterium]|nr:PHP domain-containing protein [Caldisericia bacterium]